MRDRMYLEHMQANECAAAACLMPATPLKPHSGYYANKITNNGFYPCEARR